MKNNEVVTEWYNGRDAKTKHLFNEGRIIYSYGYHFPLAIILDDGKVLINEDGYSNTTSRHKGYVKREVPLNLQVFAPTEKLKEVIDKKLFSYELLILHNIINEEIQA